MWSSPSRTTRPHHAPADARPPAASVEMAARHRSTPDDAGTFRQRPGTGDDGGLTGTKMTRTRARAQDGALAPAFLLFMIAALGGIFFFLQMGHATVLARGASTAADSAALAAADTNRGYWGQWVSWRVRCDIREALLDLELPAAPCPDPPSPSSNACSTAAEYAARNDAVLWPNASEGCQLEVTDSELRIRIQVRGTDGPQGPIDSMSERRPEATAVAVLRRPPGLLDLVNGLISQIVPNEPEEPEIDPICEEEDVDEEDLPDEGCDPEPEDPTLDTPPDEEIDAAAEEGAQARVRLVG